MERLTEVYEEGGIKAIHVKDYYDKKQKTPYLRYGNGPKHPGCDRGYCAAEKLADYEDLEEQGKLLELPCAVGDYALFSGGTIIPVIYITLSANGHITVGCQNGIRVPVDSMWGNSGSSCKGFFRTEEEAGAAWEGLRKGQEARN